MVEEYLELCNPAAIRFDGLDEAIVGFDHRGNLVYDYHKMVEVFRDDMGEDGAAEWISYNIVGINEGFTILYQ